MIVVTVLVDMLEAFESFEDGKTRFAWLTEGEP